jgi:malonyl-CoA O-methyltransferase
MIRPQAVQRNFDRASAAYDQHAPLQLQWRQQLLEAARDYFPAQAHVLDIGAGTGGMAASAPEGWRVISLDLAYGMCRQARVHGASVQADATALPLASGSVAGVLSSLCLQWVEDLGAAFSEMHRVLAPGGHVAIMSLGPQTLQELRAFDAFRLLPMRPLAAYAQAAEDAGFELLMAQARSETHDYASMGALLRSFKAIGAQAAFHARPTPLGPAAYSAMAKTYAARHPSAQGGITASWQPLMLVARKRAQA